jgi:hypothetical protein
MLAGMVPLSMLMPPRLSVLSMVRKPMLSGRVPMRMLLLIERLQEKPG